MNKSREQIARYLYPELVKLINEALEVGDAHTNGDYTAEGMAYNFLRSLTWEISDEN